MSETTVAMSAPVLRQVATRTDLEDWGSLEESDGSEMGIAGLRLWRDGNGSEAALMECAKGPSRPNFDHHELVYVLAGTMTVAADGAEPMEVGPGDAVFFVRGWAGSVHIHETLRKVYVRF